MYLIQVFIKKIKFFQEFELTLTAKESWTEYLTKFMSTYF
jgi:hypothetical protein